METVNHKVLKYVRDTRIRVSNSDIHSQKQIDEITSYLNQYKSIIMPQEKKELFSLVDDEGKEIGIYADRWICHLLGLKHKAVHIMLFFRNKTLGKICIFQIRALHKFEYPGHIDISVGGHVIKNDSISDTAEKEMREELGLSTKQILNQKLLNIANYNIEDIDDSKLFFNNEYRTLYVAEINPSVLSEISFDDREVIGLYFCPLQLAKVLISQNTLPIANALKESLPYYIDQLENENC